METASLRACGDFSQEGDGRRRIEAVEQLHLFDENIFYAVVVLPMLADLAVDRAELRRRNKREYGAVPAKL